VSVEHWSPFVNFSTQTPPAQNSVAPQPASVVQPPPQIVFEQAFEPHDW